MNPNDQKDLGADIQTPAWYMNFLLPISLIVAILLIGGLYFGYQSYSASKAPKLPTESPSNINYPQVSASGVNLGKSETAMNAGWYNEAYKTGNAALCEKITFPDRRQSCKDNIISGEASKTGNISTCDKLSTEEGKNACRNPLYYREAVAAKNTDICKKITNNDDYRDQCVSKIILDQVATTSTGKLDVSMCDNVVSDYRDTCRNQIQNKNSLDAFVQAQSSSNVEGCDAITNDALKNSCRDQLIMKSAKETKNITLCSKILDASQKERCQTSIEKLVDAEYYRNARDTNNVSLCAKIADDTTKNKCENTVYMSLALTKRDASLCDKLTQVDQKAQCNSLLNK